MVIRPQHLLPHLPQKLPKRRIPREVRPQHQRVHEKPDQRLSLYPPSSRDRRPYRDVIGARIPVQQDLESPQQRHEQRRVLPTAQRVQPVGQPPRQHHRLPPAAVALHGRPRPIRRQLQHRRHPGQLALPVAELLLQLRPLQPPPLPHRIVPVLDRQRRQRGLAALGDGPVQRRQLAREDPHRPPIRGDVVQRQQQHMLPLP